MRTTIRREWEDEGRDWCRATREDMKQIARRLIANGFVRARWRNEYVYVKRDVN